MRGTKVGNDLRCHLNVTSRGSQITSKGARVGKWSPSRSRAKTVHITWCIGGHDSSEVPQQMVLMTEPKPRAAAPSSGGQSCFQVCIWDHGQRISHLSKTASVLDCTRVSQSPNWIPKIPQRHFCLRMDAKLLLLNGRYKWRVSYLTILLTSPSQLILWENDFKLEPWQWKQ